jgi:hypothetical protein
MSITITAQAIPSVATSNWETVNEHLLRQHGDWRSLRGGLIHLVCERVTREGDPVSRLEEFLLLEFYRQPAVHVGFLDALRLVRAETSTWPGDVRNLVEYLLAQNPDFPIGDQPFPVDFNQLRSAARWAAVTPKPPKRSLDRFRRAPSQLPEETTEVLS